MKTFMKHLVALSAAFAVTQAHFQGGFQSASLNPAWMVKRALYNLDSISDQSQKDKLTQGLKDAITVAAKVLEKMDGDAHKDKLSYWFGDKRSGTNERENIRQVYKNFVGDNSDGTGSDTNGQIVVLSNDYWVPASGQLGGVGDGKTPFCSLEKDGKKGAAYYRRTGGNLEALTSNKCATLEDHISTAIWTKNFIGANVLHDFMHYPRIGLDAVGEQIGDVKYNAFQCSTLAKNTELFPNDPQGRQYKKLTIVNVDTYVWYTLEIAFSESCGKSFSNPRDERDDDETNQEWPDSDPLTDDPWDRNCICDENSCPPNSPPCCADGSCGKA